MVRFLGSPGLGDRRHGVGLAAVGYADDLATPQNGAGARTAPEASSCQTCYSRCAVACAPDQTMKTVSWEEYCRSICSVEGLGLVVDLSRMGIPDDWWATMAGPIAAAYGEMADLERGELVNTEEQRRVGHYWLRDSRRAPDAAMAQAIEETIAQVQRFAADARTRFDHFLVIGIGGSALGPQWVADALGGALDRMQPHFIDNTDPDGIDRVFAGLPLDRTLVVVISKSGGTKETRNGLLEAMAKYQAAGLNFGHHAVAVTAAGSELDRFACGWLATFPMWDWVGGRTSVLSAVGLLPAALQGFDITALLAGARSCDETTRRQTGRPLDNPALALALAWYFSGNGRGDRAMVVLPYKDRLALLSRYLQQLVMESLGKELDRTGRVVHQGLVVYGNKGSTDQHAYVQQLRDGPANFFTLFVKVLRDRQGPSIEVEPGITSGDYLTGFLLGTRQALWEKGRPSITLTVETVDARTVGELIALFERAVGFYAALIGINAYHQPGVEAGKRAAAVVISLQRQIMAALNAQPRSVKEIASELNAEPETVFQLLQHLVANPERGVRATVAPRFEQKYFV